MSLVIIVCTIVSLAAAGLVSMIWRKGLLIPLATGVLVFLVCFAGLVRPVCVLIPNEELANFRPPIESRTDTGLAGQRYFQKRSSTWFHCKAWIARKLFF